jgi:hypothetical protein
LASIVAANNETHEIVSYPHYHYANGGRDGHVHFLAVCSAVQVGLFPVSGAEKRTDTDNC